MPKRTKIERYNLAFPMSVVFGSIGVVAGLVYAIGGAIYDLINGQLGFGTVLAFMAIVGMPLLFGGIAFVLGVVIAVVYNIIAQLME